MTGARYTPASSNASLLFDIPSIDNIKGSGIVGTLTATAWGLANLGLFIPFSVPVTCIALEGWAASQTTGTGNFDIGIYDEAGTRLTSSGATAKTATAIIINTTALTDYTLVPGVRYYMGMSVSSSTDTYGCQAPAAGLCEALGVLEATSAHVLPSSVTYAKTTRAVFPYFGLNLRATAL